MRQRRASCPSMRVAAGVATILAAIAATPTGGVAQPVELSLTAGGGYDLLWNSNGDSGEALEVQLALSLASGFELGVGSEVAYQAESRVCVVPANGDGCGRRSPIFDRVKFWTLYVEPRYRVGRRSRNLQPFVGSRVSVVDVPGQGVQAYGVGGVGGIEYRFSRRFGLVAVGIVDLLISMNNIESPGADFNTPRSGLRGALRFHF